jgi:hypothetical protein
MAFDFVLFLCFERLDSASVKDRESVYLSRFRALRKFVLCNSCSVSLDTLQGSEHNKIEKKVHNI